MTLLRQPSNLSARTTNNSNNNNNNCSSSEPEQDLSHVATWPQHEQPNQCNNDDHSDELPVAVPLRTNQNRNDHDDCQIFSAIGATAQSYHDSLELQTCSDNKSQHDNEQNVKRNPSPDSRHSCSEDSVNRNTIMKQPGQLLEDDQSTTRRIQSETGNDTNLSSTTSSSSDLLALWTSSSSSSVSSSLEQAEIISIKPDDGETTILGAQTETSITMETKNSVQDFEACLESAERQLNACLDEIHHLDNETSENSDDASERNHGKDCDAEEDPDDYDEDSEEERDAPARESILRRQLSRIDLFGHTRRPSDAEHGLPRLSALLSDLGFVPPPHEPLANNSEKPSNDKSSPLEQELERNDTADISPPAAGPSVSFDLETKGPGDISTTLPAASLDACVDVADRKLMLLLNDVDEKIANVVAAGARADGDSSVSSHGSDNLRVLHRQLSQMALNPHQPFDEEEEEEKEMLENQQDDLSACLGAAERELDSGLKEFQNALVLENLDSSSQSPLSQASVLSTRLEEGDTLLKDQLSKVVLPLYINDDQRLTGLLNEADEKVTSAVATAAPAESPCSSASSVSSVSSEGSSDNLRILHRQLSQIGLNPQQPFDGHDDDDEMLENPEDDLSACVEAAERELDLGLQEFQNTVALEVAGSAHQSPLSQVSVLSTTLADGEVLLKEQLSKIVLPLYINGSKEIMISDEERQDSAEEMIRDGLEKRAQPETTIGIVQESSVELLQDLNTVHPPIAVEDDCDSVDSVPSSSSEDDYVSPSERLTSESPFLSCAVSVNAVDMERNEKRSCEESTEKHSAAETCQEFGDIAIVTSFNEVEQSLDACLAEMNEENASGRADNRSLSSRSSSSYSNASSNGTQLLRTAIAASDDSRFDSGELHSLGNGQVAAVSSRAGYSLENRSELSSHKNILEEPCETQPVSSASEKNEYEFELQALDQLILKAATHSTCGSQEDMLKCTTGATQSFSSRSSYVKRAGSDSRTTGLDSCKTSEADEYLTLEITVDQDHPEGSILMPGVSSWEFLDDAEHDSHHEDFLQSQNQVVLEVGRDEDMALGGSEYDEVTVSDESRSFSCASPEAPAMPKPIALFRHKTDTDVVAARRRRKIWLSQARQIAAVPSLHVSDSDGCTSDEEESFYEEETVETFFEDPLARALAETKRKIASGVLSKRNVMTLQKLHQRHQKQCSPDQANDRGNSVSSGTDQTMSMTCGSFTNRSEGEGKQTDQMPESNAQRRWRKLRQYAAQVVRNNLPKARAMLEDSQEKKSSSPKLKAAVSVTFLADPLSPATVNRVLCQAWDLLAPGGRLYITHVIHRHGPEIGADDGGNEVNAEKRKTSVTCLGPYVPKRMKDWILRAENDVKDNGGCRDVAHRVHELETLQLLNGYKGGSCTFHPLYDNIQRWKGIKPIADD